MIRFLCLNAFIAIHSIIFCSLAVVLSFFDKTGRLVHFYVSMPWAKAILWVSGIKVEANGQENVIAEEPCIYMSNHQSYFDIFALLAYLPVDFKFIMKQELMKIPLLGLAMRRAGHMGIKRGSPKEAIRNMDKAAEKIKRGTSVVIFPEGTRSIDGRLQPLKKGGFNMALKAGCDIVPVAISNSYRIVPKNSLKVNKGSIDLHIGKAISVRGYSRNNMAELMGIVKEAMLNQMGASGADLKPGHETNDQPNK